MVKRPRLSYRAILEFCNARCANPKCRSKNNLTINHKTPLSQGGTNDPKNCQLLCRRCNYFKNPRKEPVDLMCECVWDWAEHSELKENRRMEPLFRQWVLKKMMEKNPRRLDYFINAGAEHTGASTETTKRYIRKMTSDEGYYVIIHDPMKYQYLHFREKHLS